jgi:hypothetical protein
MSGRTRNWRVVRAGDEWASGRVGVVVGEDDVGTRLR